MSDLRDALGAWSADRGEEVAASVRAHTAQTRAAAGRRRARNLTLAAAASVVGLVAASGIAIAGPWSAAEPATEATSAPPDLAAIVCGAPWTLDEGTITHDPSAPAYFGGVSGDWVKHTDSGEVIADPDSLWAGFESLAWEGVPLLNGNVAVQALVVAEQDGVIVSDPSREFLSGDAPVSVDANLPAACSDVDAPPASGEYTYHLVITAVLADGSERALQTIVDPGGPQPVEITALEDMVTAPTGGLVEPAGDTYRAFLVHKLDGGSCTPYQDALDNGAPTHGKGIDYRVTIPGVQPITGEVWANKPAAVIEDPDYSAWYVGLPTAIVASEFEGGDPLGALEWTTGPAVGESEGPGSLRLVNTWDAAPVIEYGEGCAYTAPVPTIGGAVYLIIDGADWDAFGETYPLLDVADPADFQTWVYLGQAS